MSDKTIDFSKYIPSEFTHPLDKKAIMEVLKILLHDNDVVWNYIDHCAELIGDLNLWRDIFSSISHPSRCESLIDALSQEQLIHFSKIVMGLKRTIELNDFTEICNATLKFETPTDASLKKAFQLIEIMSKKEELDLESIAADILQLGKHLRILGGLLFNYKSKKSDDTWAANIAHLPKEDLDDLIILASSIFETSTISLNSRL